MATRTSAPGIVAPEALHPLLILPLQRESIALNPTVSGTVLTDRESYRFPRLTSDPSSAWLEEGGVLPTEDIGVDQITVRPRKLGCLVPVTSELLDDSAEDVLTLVGDALVRKATEKLDTAFLGALASPAPAGLQALAAASGSEVQTIAAGTDWPLNLDWAATAASKIEQVGGRMTAVIVNPADALAISTIKVSTGSVQPLLSPGGDPAAPARRQVEGVPLLVSAKCPAGTAWAVDGSRNFTVINREARIVTDRSVFALTDRIAVIMTLRLAYGFTDPRTVVKITKTA